MARLKTNGRKKLAKALKRVAKVVIMDIRKQLDQQRKRKAEVMKRRSWPSVTASATPVEAKVTPVVETPAAA